MAPFVVLLGSMTTVHAVVELAVAPMIFATKVPNYAFYLDLFAFVVEAPGFDGIWLVVPLRRIFGASIFTGSKLGC